MQEVFCRVLEMSMTGCFCIGVVLLIRFWLIKMGRKYAYYLWIAVFLNLIFPFAIQGKYSLIPKQAEFSVEMNEDTGQIQFHELNLRSPAVSIEETEKMGEAHRIRYSDHSREQLQEGRSGKTISVRLLRNIWMSGVALIFLFNAAHIFRVKRQISTEQWVDWDDKDRIAQVRGLSAPFLWGIIRPIIFLPTGLEEKEKEFIIIHESCHRKRRDPLVKLVAFCAVTVHWFNPAVWLAWVLFCRDMEISCDEAALAGAGKETRSRYAQSILRYAAMQNGYFMTPPTFGEPSAKLRIKSVLQYREHGRISEWMAGSIVVVAVFGLTIHPVRREALDLAGYVNTLALRNNNVARAISAEPETSTDAMEINEDKADLEEGQTEARHREGYVEAVVTHIPLSLYYTPGLRDQKELDDLAQQALRELYDLTGFQVESCAYSCTDLGTFFFAKTEEDLEHSRSFYTRSYGEREGYSAISSMDIVNARRVWFSDVQQLDIPHGIEQMDEAELAVWFLENSSIYQGEQIIDIRPSPDSDAYRIIAEDGSYYEVSPDIQIQAVSSIYGPYPEGASH